MIPFIDLMIFLLTYDVHQYYNGGKVTHCVLLLYYGFFWCDIALKRFHFMFIKLFKVVYYVLDHR